MLHTLLMCGLERCLGQDAKETEGSAGKPERVLQEAGRAPSPRMGSSQGCGSLAFLSHKLRHPEDSALTLPAQCSAYNVHLSPGLCSTEARLAGKDSISGSFLVGHSHAQAPNVSVCALLSSDHPRILCFHISPLFPFYQCFPTEGIPNLPPLGHLSMSGDIFLLSH